MSEGSAGLLTVLGAARQLGFLGPGPVEQHVRLAHAMVAGVDEAPRRALDLGSGGGVPGLVLAAWWPATEWVLLDSSQRRTAFLAEAVAELALGDRVRVVRARAEAVGRDPAWRGAFDLVVARGFGPPAVTAECGAPLLQIGGRLVVAEPPAAPPDRWPPTGLAELGLEVAGRSSAGQGGAWIALRADRTCPARYPRAVGRPAKRPLWPSDAARPGAAIPPVEPAGT